MDHLGHDRLLLEGLAKQDSTVIESIYRLHFPMIQHMILNHRGSADDAADIFQEAMIVLYEKSTDPSFILSSQIKTYLYSVSRRLWLKRLQKNSRSVVQDDDIELLVSVEDDLEDHDSIQQRFAVMESALAKLGEPCRGLLTAFYLERKPMQEIAEAFHYTSADNAKTQKYKCLVRLKKLFFSEYKNK